MSNLTANINKLAQAFVNSRPISFNYRPEKSKERRQKPVIKITDLKVIKNSYLLVLGVNLNRITPTTNDVSEAQRSYRLDRMSHIKVL